MGNKSKLFWPRLNVSARKWPSILTHFISDYFSSVLEEIAKMVIKRLKLMHNDDDDEPENHQSYGIL